MCKKEPTHVNSCYFDRVKSTTSREHTAHARCEVGTYCSRLPPDLTLTPSKASRGSGSRASGLVVASVRPAHTASVVGAARFEMLPVKPSGNGSTRGQRQGNWTNVADEVQPTNSILYPSGFPHGVKLKPTIESLDGFHTYTGSI